MHGREYYEFKNLEELVVTSPVIVYAEVTNIQPGRSIGSAEDGGIDQARNVTLSVKTSYRMGFVSAPSIIVMEEWGWDGEGNGYQLENVKWSKVGDKGFYFLNRDITSDEPWQLVNTQGRLLGTQNDFLESSADPESEFYAHMSTWETPELDARLKRLLDTKNPPPDLPEPLEAPEPATGDPESPAPEDGADEPIPDDSTDDGSEPTPYPSPSPEPTSFAGPDQRAESEQGHHG